MHVKHSNEWVSVGPVIDMEKKSNILKCIYANMIMYPLHLFCVKNVTNISVDG